MQVPVSPLLSNVFSCMDPASEVRGDNRSDDINYQRDCPRFCPLIFILKREKKDIVTKKSMAREKEEIGKDKVITFFFLFDIKKDKEDSVKNLLVPFLFSSLFFYFKSNNVSILDNSFIIGCSF